MAPAAKTARPKTAAATQRASARPEAAAPETPAYSAPALDKGLDILEALTDAEHGSSMAEIAQTLGRSVSEIFRMVVTLERRGWISSDPGDRYHLTSKMFELAHRNRPVRTLVEAALPTMQLLSRRARQSCHLSIVESGRVLVIAHVEAPGTLSLIVRTGSVVGLFNTSSGHVFLAFRTPAERERLIEDHSLIAGESPAGRGNWQSAVEQVARDGYACSPSEQLRGVTNLACPVWGRNRHVVAALVMPYVEGLGAQRGPSLEESRAQLIEGAAAISRSLGYQLPEAGAS
ncbi:MAG: IclR family transcriptional regulator [Burkholderiales bacterium]|nr:IclR family transcriptional regulator [Burkholderiales bacterium]MDE2453815.1 IclR family transcriptional regulator [Burkholderiales bacterium]